MGLLNGLYGECVCVSVCSTVFFPEVEEIDERVNDTSISCASVYKSNIEGTTVLCITVLHTYMYNIYTKYFYSQFINRLRILHQ